eukprot:7830879-Ditylum_brightwellii.AAC.1
MGRDENDGDDVAVAKVSIFGLASHASDEHEEQCIDETCKSAQTAHGVTIESNGTDKYIDSPVTQKWDKKETTSKCVGMEENATGTVKNTDDEYHNDDESEDETYDSQIDDSDMYTDGYEEDLDDTHDLFSIASTVLAEHRREKLEAERNKIDSMLKSEAQNVVTDAIDNSQENESDSDDTTVTE